MSSSGSKQMPAIKTLFRLNDVILLSRASLFVIRKFGDNHHNSIIGEKLQNTTYANRFMNYGDCLQISK
jgi:hypothetical protein